MDTKTIEARVDSMLAVNKNNMSRKEYLYFADGLNAATPCNCLIFGCGMDSGLWRDINVGGRTIFLENNSGWLDKTIDEYGIEGYSVKYSTMRVDWANLLGSFALGEMPYSLKLPELVDEIDWDIILVDGPMGHQDNVPGRMESIYAAFETSRRCAGGEIYIHDCHRPVEAVYGDFFFGRDCLVEQIYHLRHYRPKVSPATP